MRGGRGFVCSFGLLTVVVVTRLRRVSESAVMFRIIIRVACSGHSTDSIRMDPHSDPAVSNSVPLDGRRM